MQTGPSRKRRERIIAWLAWFAALNVLWLALISAFVLEETVLGLFASALAATAAVAVREQGLVRFRPRMRWLLGVWRLPSASVRESGWILAALFRTLSGRDVRGRFRIRSVDLPEDPTESQTKRALLIAGESFAPNTYVLGIDEGTGEMLVHELIARPEE